MIILDPGTWLYQGPVQHMQYRVWKDGCAIPQKDNNHGSAPSDTLPIC